MTPHRKWLLLAPLGLLLIGTGLSLFGEAVILKYRQVAFGQWFGYGTLSLVVFNAGLSVFGEAVVSRARHLAQKEKKQ